MKKFLVILLGLLLAGISGTLVFRELGSYAPTPSVTFETAVPATENANHPSSPSPENDGLLMPFGSDINAAVHAKRIEYGDYRTGVIGEQKVLLFFSSSSDPMSVDHDKQLSSLYFGGKALLSTYRIDYDTAAALGRKYGVISSDTFVLLDNSGSILRSATNPSEDVLEGLLK